MTLIFDLFDPKTQAFVEVWRMEGPDATISQEIEHLADKYKDRTTSFTILNDKGKLFALGCRNQQLPSRC